MVSGTRITVTRRLSWAKIQKDQSRVHFGYSLKRLPEDPAASDLHAIYSDLRQRSYEAWAEDCSEIQATPKTPEKFSFNMAMTVSAMVICPRTRDGCTLGSVGDVTLNGTMLAGTFMVKEEKLWEFIKREPQVPMNAIEDRWNTSPFRWSQLFLKVARADPQS